MLYRQKNDSFIREFKGSDGVIGYITNPNGFGDRVFDSVGAVFLAALSREPQSLDELTEKIMRSFIDADYEIVRNDAESFYAILVEDGFIVSGGSKAECDAGDMRFTYATVEPSTVKQDFRPAMRRATETSQEFLEEYFKTSPQLTQFQIELSSRCNERCVHCYIPHADKLTDIEPSLFNDVLKQCRDMGVLELKLSGGEPMIHQNFVDFLYKAKDCDLSVSVLSNLTLLNDEIISALKAGRHSQVHVSLYSIRPEIHDSITRLPGSFDKTMSAIMRLIENDIPIQISCPIMRINKSEYGGVLKWAGEHKINAETDYIMMARSNQTTDNLENRLTLEETEAVLKDIMSQDVNYQRNLLEADLALAGMRDTSNEILCSVCVTSLCMDSSGIVYPCPGWNSYVCGNVKETPLSGIWENSPAVKYLRGIRKKDLPVCLECPDKNFCSICMVRNANENLDGNPLKINEHFCKVAALNRKIVMEWKAKAAM